MILVFLILTASIFTAFVLALLLLAAVIKQRNMHRWLRSYFAQRYKIRAPITGPVHVLICIGDHYEPQVGKPSAKVAAARVKNWVTQYPALLGNFKDSDGRPPRHSFFFPIDEYDKDHVDAIAGLCRQGFGEVEIHLHHDHDTAEGLIKKLDRFARIFRETHGLLPRDKSGRNRFGFIHGNWALDNSRPDGRWCGVNNELDVLRDAGCYADFTLPSAPSAAQTRKINSIYYAVDDPAKPRSHDSGLDVGHGPPPKKSLLLIQGPLLLNWKSRKFGLIPRVENGCIQAGQPPTVNRLDLWLQARIQIPNRPDWYFIKLHTHGALEKNQRVLLGEPMIQFHRALAARAAADNNFHYHYVTAREMYNLAKAAEANFQGLVADARDYELTWDVESFAATRAPTPVSAAANALAATTT